MNTKEILLDLEQRFEVLNRLRAPVWIYDVEGFQMLWANREGLALWDAETLQEMRERDFQTTQSEAMYTVLLGYLRTIQAGETVDVWYTLEPKGRPKRVFMHHSGVQLADERVVMFVEGIPEPPAEHLLGMLENVPLTIALYSQEGQLLSSNPSFRNLLSIDAKENLPMERLFKEEEHRRAFLASLDKHKPTSVESSFDTILGTRWFRIEGRLVVSETLENQILLNLYDITQQKREHVRLTNLATKDSLTRVLNRHGFAELAGKIEQAYPRRFVMYIDLDGFKLINDTLGHSIGDKVLREVGQRLQQFTLDETVIGRIGGDEFVLCASLKGERQAVVEAAQRLLWQISRPFEIEGKDLFLTASYGLCFCLHEELTLEEMITRADYAMYKAKNLGKNTGAVFDREMFLARERELKIRSSLQEAVQNKELFLLVQPIVDIRNEVVRVECLLRWNHPEMGVVSPNDFVPVAEESGFIVSIGDWVMREACRVAKQWELQGLKVPVSINVSGYQFPGRELGAVVREVLEEQELPGDLLEIELTETTLMHRLEEARLALDDFQRMGVRVSIDDYGTGYSSLAVLLELPIQTIKLDRAFVCKLESKANREIVRSTIVLAQRLGMGVVCEGVETEEQLAVLSGLGGTLFQGYFFARPMRVEEFPAWLTTQREGH